MLITILLLLISCTPKAQVYEEQLINVSKKCKEVPKECNLRLSVFDKMVPSREEKENLSEKCNLTNMKLCEFNAYVSSLRKDLVYTALLSKKLCDIGSVYGCKLGFEVSNKDTEKLFFSSAACRFGDVDYCSSEVTALINLKKYEEAIKNAEVLCNKKRMIDCYNLACAYSLSGDFVKTNSSILSAIDLGFSDSSKFYSDIDLKSFRDSSFFKKNSSIISKKLKP